MTDEALGPAELTALLEPAAHPGDPSAAEGVRHLQTHISQVFLTGQRVYKFRKAVDLGFLRFGSRAERNADCLHELALNRRLAPDVYLGIAALRREGGRTVIGPVSETLRDSDGGDFEHCVVMRRLPEGRDALSLLGRGTLTLAQLERLARRVAGFHAEHRLGEAAPATREAWLERITTPVEDNFRSLAAAEPSIADPAQLERARERARSFVEQQGERFEARRLAGRTVDGHGDLHLQHVWFESDDAEPLVIDCVEFSRRLREIDAASEVAFPAMDLAYRGATRLTEGFLAAYARESDDFDLYRVVDYFIAYRAGVRAKVAAIAAGEAEIEAAQRQRAAESAGRHLRLAAEALAPRPPAALVLVAGVVGSGKSSAAAEIASAAGGAAIASDRVRKHLAGMPATARGGAEWKSGIYRPEHTERTYAGLLERARPVLESGRVAVLDATFAERRHRDAARELARELAIPAFCVEARCDEEVTRARLARRAAAGRDPSDAGPELLAASVARFQALDEWPEARRIEVRTEQEDWRKGLGEWAAGLIGTEARP